jgi:3-methyladenine DNA glycosylase AlkD
MSRIVEDVRKDLVRNADEKTRASGERFFKDPVRLYGVKASVTTSIAKDHFRKLSDKSKNTIFGYCDEFWKSGKMEESFIACNWSYFVNKEYLPEDLNVFRKWINNYVTNWASCDTFCNHTVGTFMEMYPESLSELRVWAKSGNRWMRRASAVSLIVPARRGRFPEDIFKIASILLTDSDDMVQKGYGWMLKEASRLHQEEVYKFVTMNKKEMPRTAYRYAIEKMPPELRKKAMEKDLPL